MPSRRVSSSSVLASSLPAFAAGGYANARDLQTDCRTALKFAELVASVSPKLYDAGYCYGFLSGVADTIVLTEKIPALGNVVPDELGRVVLKYFDAHPEVLSLSAATAVRMAFRQEYSKPQNR